MSEVAGNPVSALILQVVAYYNLTVVQAGLNEENYKVIRERWESGGKDKESDMPLKLSCAEMSDISGTDKETVRRTIKKLAEQQWVVINKQTGIHYQLSVSNQDKLLTLNDWEISHLGRLMERLKERKNESRSTFSELRLIWCKILTTTLSGLSQKMMVCCIRVAGSDFKWRVKCLN